MFAAGGQTSNQRQQALQVTLWRTALPKGHWAREHFRLTLLDLMNTTVEQLQVAGHEPGPQRRCAECRKLKRIEDKWIMRLGTLHGASGLSTRDEIVSAVRGNFKLN